MTRSLWVGAVPFIIFSLSCVEPSGAPDSFPFDTRQVVSSATPSPMELTFRLKEDRLLLELVRAELPEIRLEGGSLVHLKARLGIQSESAEPVNRTEAEESGRLRASGTLELLIEGDLLSADGSLYELPIVRVGNIAWILDTLDFNPPCVNFMISAREGQWLGETWPVQNKVLGALELEWLACGPNYP